MQQHHHKQQQRQQQSHDLSRDSFSPPPVSDSSFSSSVVVDIDAIELDKENIQPLRQGRSAQTLARLFTTQHEDRAQQQATMHGRFQEELVHIDDLDDPIDVYSRYVKWMIENYPQSAGQGHDSQLSPVIERAIADYKDDPRYRNDPRFVKLLIIYSEQIANAIDLFNFMESNGIGSEISMYYEEFADLLESREEFDRAREVFNKGISRRARPLGRLRKQYEDFKLRARTFEDAQELESARANSAQQQPQHHTQDRSVETNTGGGNQRRVLGVKISGTQSVHSNASSQGHVPIGLERPQSSSTTSATRGTTLSGQPRTDTKLQVYSDHASQPSVPKPKAIPQNPTSQPSTQWMDFGAEKIRRKENTREVTSWKGATLSSEDTVARQVHPKLEVYRDPEVVSSYLASEYDHLV
ncbi:MAG: Mad3/BUB1 homology region 1-domain-containing protein [Linnemannia gamsii]|nr:MAG: Mad3/BUB1 homology region 1-domain-containing protein [Linnemannia gamsii]